MQNEGRPFVLVRFHVPGTGSGATARVRGIPVPYYEALTGASGALLRHGFFCIRHGFGGNLKLLAPVGVLRHGSGHEWFSTVSLARVRASLERVRGSNNYYLLWRGGGYG